MNTRMVLGAGIAGTVITALCCFTPLLVVGMAAVGLSALTGYLDWVLLPALGFFLALTAYALWAHRKSTCIDKEGTCHE